MAKYSGRNGVVYMSSTGTGTAVPLVSMANWTFDGTTDKIDVTEFGAGNKQWVQGFKAGGGRISGFWNDSEGKPFDGADSSDGVKLYLYPSSDAASKYIALPAWVDVSIEVPVNGAVTCSIDFSPNGAVDLSHI